ncbi:MAG: hypothetical protein IJ571_02525 [Ruminococcus sp.]|nr:hypothetical protein [Ruminococcus sp.]
MDTAIITALITAAASVLCQILIQRTVTKESRSAREKQYSLILYRLEQLERAVSKQSGMLERLSVAEQRITNIERSGARAQRFDA